MKKIACQYAIVRFAPYVETEEFANVGIVLIAPGQRFYGFKLETRRYGRITRFFEDMDASLYRNALFNLKEELERIADLLKAHGFDKRLKQVDVEFAQRLFQEMVRPRETIVRYGQLRTVLAEDPQKTLDELFAFYVERNFVTKKYKEQILESGVRKLLYRIKVGNLYEKARVGNSSYHVNLPFVHRLDDHRLKIIKPLHLAQPESTRIYNHGDAWIRRIKRLKGKYIDPQKLLFTLEGPEEEGERRDAYLDIKRELEQIGAQTAQHRDEKAIEKFASVH